MILLVCQQICQQQQNMVAMAHANFQIRVYLTWYSSFYTSGDFGRWRFHQDTVYKNLWETVDLPINITCKASVFVCATFIFSFTYVHL